MAVFDNELHVVPSTHSVGLLVVSGLSPFSITLALLLGHYYGLS